jgi:ATP-dependent Clp protease adapter protein ClpS
MSQHPLNRPDEPVPPGKPARPDQGRNSPIPRVKLILQTTRAADLMVVVRTVMELTHLGRAEATHKMWEAHYSGRSQLLVTFKERAEFFIEQFARRGLTVTMEPA